MQRELVFSLHAYMHPYLSPIQCVTASGMVSLLVAAHGCGRTISSSVWGTKSLVYI